MKLLLSVLLLLFNEISFASLSTNPDDILPIDEDYLGEVYTPEATVRMTNQNISLFGLEAFANYALIKAEITEKNFFCPQFINMNLKDGNEIHFVDVMPSLNKSKRHNILSTDVKLAPRYSCEFKQRFGNQESAPCSEIQKHSAKINKKFSGGDELVEFSSQTNTLVIKKEVGFFGQDDGRGEFLCIYRKTHGYR